ncbi:hypothetical protein REPUB_Repub01dG0193700 [Reevesia pubescens]
MVKFNIDGSSRGSPVPTSCGGVLRNCDGTNIAFFSGPIGMHDANIADLLAILIALDVSLKSKKCDNVSLVIESAYVIAIN